MSPRSLLALIALLPGWSRGEQGSAPVPAPQPDPTPAGVLAIMERVADWQLAHPSEQPRTGWAQGAFYAGAMALAGISDSPRFLDAMVRMGEAAKWRLGARPYDADDHCVGQTYAEIYLLRHDSGMIQPLRERFDWILEHPGDRGFDLDTARNPRVRDRWSWCDSLFMGPPAWIRLYAATGDRRYLEFVTANWWISSAYLYDKQEHLFFRDSTYFEKREANGQKIFWSRGNGWVMAGLVRVLQFLPVEEPSRVRFEQQFREMAERILTCQQEDGLWRASLLDPAEYPLQETSGSGFYCFALAWGVNHGLLERTLFEPAVLKAWHGMLGCVTPEGRLTHVQPVGADPRQFDGDATEVYGVGAFLLAGSEVYRLARNESKE